MADAHILMPLTKMVDLVTQPDEGVINFNMLHTVLHVLVEQLNAGELSVELHGPTATKLQHMIDSDNLKKPSVHITKVVGGEKKDKTDAATETVIVVKPEQYGEHFGVTVTKQQLDKINKEIEDMKKTMEELIDLPSNAGLIEAIRSEIQPSPVIDMFQILNLSKRIDAAEIGMNKLAGLVEEAIKTPPLKSTICYDKPDTEKTSFSVRQLSTQVDGVDNVDEVDKVDGVDEDLPSSDARLNNLIQEVASIKRTLDNLVLPPLDHDLTNVSEASFEEEKETAVNSLAQLYKDVQEIKNRLFNKKSEDLGSEDDFELPSGLKLQLLEEKFKDCTEQLESIDQNFNDEITKLHNQFTDIEKEFNIIMLKVCDGIGADKDLEEPPECCSAVYKKLIKLQTDFDDLADKSIQIFNEKENSKDRMDMLLEEINLLKTIKADKEYLDEALADKADACTVQRKVSHDQFDNACDNLSKGIEEALEKLTHQEIIWQDTLDGIQGEIGTKLDKIDLGPLREFINNKLKMLQDKMKSLAALKRDQEAAGSKNKLLRDVNCISCDKEVVMRKEMDIGMRPQAHALPPTRSMGPYLAYELDVLRKQQKSVPGSRNLNDIERAIQLGKSKKKLNEDHICNRYCGGSHTITTPQQRVTRLGHFLAQWGPEATPQIESSAVDSTNKQEVPAEANLTKDSKENEEKEKREVVRIIKKSIDRKSGQESQLKVRPETAQPQKISGSGDQLSISKKGRTSSAEIRRVSKHSAIGSSLKDLKISKSSQSKGGELRVQSQENQEGIARKSEEKVLKPEEKDRTSEGNVRKSEENTEEINTGKPKSQTSVEGRKSKEKSSKQSVVMTARKSEEVIGFTTGSPLNRSKGSVIEGEGVPEVKHLEDILENEDVPEGTE